MHDKEEEVDRETMHHRRITLADGRYMIFYTFDDVRPEAELKNEQGEDV